MLRALLMHSNRKLANLSETALPSEALDDEIQQLQEYSRDILR